MSGTAAKAHRRELRRAMGDKAVGTLAEVQANQRSLAASVTNAHTRIDQLESALRGLLRIIEKADV